MPVEFLYPGWYNKIMGSMVCRLDQTQKKFSFSNYSSMKEADG